MPPPLYFAACFGAAWMLHRRWPWELPADEGGVVRVLGGYGLIALAGLLGGSGIVTFLRHRTPILPGRPARAMVTGGPYRLTRNPMYVGLFLLYAGVTLRLGWVWPLCFVPLLFGLLNYRIIPGEERHLADRFGAGFEDYRSRVRRWL